jgi:hypothetical protein
MLAQLLLVLSISALLIGESAFLVGLLALGAWLSSRRNEPVGSPRSGW